MVQEAVFVSALAMNVPKYVHDSFSEIVDYHGVYVNILR